MLWGNENKNKIYINSFNFFVNLHTRIIIYFIDLYFVNFTVFCEYSNEQYNIYLN